MLLPWIELLLCIACKIELWDAQESMGFMVSIRDPVASLNPAPVAGATYSADSV